MKFSTTLGALGLLTTLACIGCSNPPTSAPPGTTGTGGSGSGGSASGTGGSASGTGGSASGTGGSASGTGGDTGTGGSGSGGSGSGGAAGTGGGAAGTDGGAGATGTGGTDGGGTGGSAPAGCPAGVLGHCNSTTAMNTYPGFTLALAEEFDEPINLDTDPIWTWSDGGPPEGRARFVKNAVTFADGKMIITASATNVAASQSFAESIRGAATGPAAARPVQSGEFRTKYNNYRYGRYEVRYKAPIANPGFDQNAAQAGNFLATMFIFRTPKWQDWNEIDFELEGNLPNTIAYNIVNATNADGYPAGNAAPGTSPRAAPYKIIDVHTYAFEWLPTKITFYVDNMMFREFTPTGNVPIPNKSAKIMMNLWVFRDSGAFGNVDVNKYPFRAEYEYFRFYKWNTETTYPLANPKMLPADDVDFSKNNPAEAVYP